jgi:hypothetical protein
MTTNRWIETSRKIYAAFLALYPQEHHAEFGESMRQVFTDQCRSAYAQKGAFGILLLWLRTLPDLGYTALLEHLTSPRAAWGLVEPVPNAPLPWKGVFLILLPGLVFLLGQIAQLTGTAWYMTLYYRAAFVLIIPVLAVWAITRRFPIWGLIPIGLLYRLIQDTGYQWVITGNSVKSSNPIINTIFKVSSIFNQELTIPTLLLLLITLPLVWHYLKQDQQPSGKLWRWLGLFFLIPIIELTYYFISNQQALATGETWSMLKSLASWSAYILSTQLLLVFIGALFTRSHGLFAILVPLGYTLPRILIGTTWEIGHNSTPTILLIFSVAILLYRFILSLLAPIWISRSSSLDGKKRAILVSTVLALGIHAAMQFYPALIFSHLNQITTQWVVYVVADELKLISAFLLAIAIYQNVPQTLEKDKFGRDLNHKRVIA